MSAQKIHLTQGYVALVDEEDFGFLSRWSWSAEVKPRADGTSRVYACSGERRGGRQRHIYMHAEIAGRAPDHVNGNALDNRRCNLRPASKAQNGANQRKTRGSSRFKGVCWDRRRGRWVATIKVDGKQRYLGRFDDEVDAARAYNAAAAEAFGEYALLNVVP